MNVKSISEALRHRVRLMKGCAQLLNAGADGYPTPGAATLLRP